MIAILDTNVFWGDVSASRQALSALITASDAGLVDEIEIWTPRGVIEELVRQYPARLGRVQKVLASIENELSAYGLAAPELPSAAPESVTEYRTQLEARLTGRHRRVVDHPRASGKIVDWVATRRRPIRASTPASVKKVEKDLRHFLKLPPLPVYGVVDAAIWLTVIEAAAADRVVLITDNSNDFSERKDIEKPCEALRKDLDEAGVNPDKVTILPSVFEFNRRFVEPVQEAQDRAEAFLADPASLEALKAEIADAALWMSVTLSDADEFGVGVDEVDVQHVDVEQVALERADPANAGFFATFEAYGEAELDLGIRKANAVAIDDSSDVEIWDSDYNESMVRATAHRQIQMRIEARFEDRRDGQLAFDLSVEEIVI